MKDQLDFLDAISDLRDKLVDVVAAEEARRLSDRLQDAHDKLEEAALLSANALALLAKGKFHANLDPQVRAVRAGLRAMAKGAR